MSYLWGKHDESAVAQNIVMMKALSVYEHTEWMIWRRCVVVFAGEAQGGRNPSRPYSIILALRMCSSALLSMMLSVYECTECVILHF